ncbi:MAG: peptidoglycan bridge formation glycyltransferase FemA/FemB family protein [Erysipelotrichales bacterium]|nr:peptidoglycan bridge formation glycyltransferase FemA/FemB family protein [Erysipelotrichales bacterium]
MYNYKIDIPTEELDALSVSHQYTSIYQSSAWCNVKKDWGMSTIGVYKDGVLVGGSYILKRKVVLNFTLGYMTRGPLLDFSDEPMVKCFFEGLKVLAKREHMISVKFDPNIFDTYVISDKENAMNYRNDELVSLLNKYNCKHLGYTMDLYDAVQPRMQLTLPKVDDLNERFPKKTRDKLKQAKENHVEIEEKGIEGVHEFTRLIELTESRKGIVLRDEAYFKTMMSAFTNKSTLLFAYVNLKEKAVDLEMKYNELTNKLQSLDAVAVNKIEETKKRIAKVEREQAEVKALREKDGDRPLVSALLLVRDNETAELLYSGLNGDYRKFYAAYKLREAAIEWTFNKGCTYFNFGGVECQFDGGLFEFKSSFHPDIRTYVGEFDFVVNPILFVGMNKGIHYVKLLKMKLAKKG